VTATRPVPGPDATALLRDALASARNGDKVRSHNLFALAVDLDPSNEAAWLWYANTASDPALAVRGLRMALRLNPTNQPATAALPTALYRAGVTAAKNRDRAAAAEYLAEATALDPANEGAWLWRAGVCDEPTDALGFLERVLKLNPNNEQARAGAAKLRAQLAPAWECPVCAHAASHDDTLTDDCPECGCVIALGNPTAFDEPPRGLNEAVVREAAKRLKAEWSATAKPTAAYGLGLALLNLGYPDEALKAFQTAVRAEGSNPDWRANVAALANHRRRGPVAVAPPPPPPKPLVMVVDDSATVRAMVSELLTGAGYRVAAAESAEAAAKLVQGGTVPKLFVLDVNMPGTDGFGLCKALRAHAQTAGVPVVFLTGKTGLLSKLHGRWVGAAEYMTKPFQPDKLLATVGRLAPLART
jgi:twitching motility two-component system response regulator PilG